MELSEYSRYGRQMILPGFGLEAQLKLRQAKVLVIGAGGLGCPAIQYLAGAGVGHITVVDHDVVETSNLARQILHTDERVGIAKAESAAIAARAINPHITVIPFLSQLHDQNAHSLISAHDLVLDCTDNVLTRYLISDAAVLAGVQVVSGAAQGFEGQLIVLNKVLDDEDDASVATGEKTRERGPCYRCLFPKAPRPEDVTDCAEGGVLGGVTGLVGTMQALEAVKLLTGVGEVTPASMTLVSPLSFPPFRSVKLRPRKAASCRACGDADLVGFENVIRDLRSEDYVSFCGLGGASTRDDAVESVSVGALASRWQSGKTCVLDVRPSIEYGITHLPNAINLPFTAIRRDVSAALLTLRSQVPVAVDTVYVLCRRGNDSITTVSLLQAALSSHDGEAKLRFVDVKGGLVAWSRDVDPQMPVY